jgi:hypothetical protein
MRLRILSSALEDLDRGRRFYERQGAGLGVYFLIWGQRLCPQDQAQRVRNEAEEAPH